MSRLYTSVRDQALSLAARSPSAAPATELAMVRAYISDALRLAWIGALWPETLTLEAVTATATTPDTPADPTTATTVSAAILIDRRIGQVNEIGDVVGMYSANPQTTTLWRDLDWEYSGLSSILITDRNNLVTFFWTPDGLGSGSWSVPTPLTVYLEWQAPAPDLMVLSDTALAALTIPTRMANYCAYRAAGQLFRGDGQHEAGAEYMAQAEGLLADELTQIKLPPRHRRVRFGGMRQ